MRRLRDQPVTEEDLSLTKNVMAGEFGRALESPSTLAYFALSTFRYNLPRDYYATYLERLEKVTIADIQAMAKKYLQPDNCIILVVGNKAEVPEKIAGFAASGKVEYYDRYGNPVVDQPVALPEGLTAANVIDLYLQAIGGKQNVKGIRQVTTKATGRIEAMGQKMELSMEIAQQAPGLLCQQMKMGDMVVSKQVYNGQQGWAVSPRGSQDIQGPDLEKMKDGALLFPELLYFTAGFQTTLEGIEKIDGRNAYRMNVKYPSGSVETEYFEIGSGLKIRKISRTESQAGTIETISDYGDYRDIGGVKFPFSMKAQVSGQLIDMQVDSIDTSTPVNPAVFKK
jgi:hypothetical protein